MFARSAFAERGPVLGQPGAIPPRPPKRRHQRTSSKLRDHPRCAVAQAAIEAGGLADTVVRPPVARTDSPSSAGACRRSLQAAKAVHRCLVAAQPGLGAGAGLSIDTERRCGHSCGISSRLRAEEVDSGACWRDNDHKLSSVRRSHDGSPRAARLGRGGLGDADEGPPCGDCE